MILLVLSNTLWPLGYSMYIGYFPLYIEELGGTKLTISILASIPFFMGLLAILGGYLADRIDRKALLFIGWVVTVPAPLIWAFADNWKWLLAGQLLYSMTAICIPALTLYVFEYNSPGDKMTPYSLVNVGGIAGSILAPSIGAEVIARYDIKTLFLLVFVVYTLSTLCILFMSKQVPDKIQIKADESGIKDTLKELKANKILPVMFFLSALLFCMNISEPYISVYLSDHYSMSVKMIGNAFTCIFIGASLLTWLFGKNTSKYNPHHIVLIGVTLFLTSIVAVTALDNPTIIYGGFFMRGVNRALLFFVQGVIVSRLNSQNKGLILSIFISIRNIFVGLAAYPGAFLYGIHPVAPFIAEGVLLIIWVFFSFSPNLRSFYEKQPKKV